MSIDLEDGTIHEKCFTCGKWVCECGTVEDMRVVPYPLCQACILSDDWSHCQMKYENDRALVVPGANGSGVSCAVASDPDIPLVAGGSATIRSAWVVVLSIGAVGLAILWEVVR